MTILDDKMMNWQRHADIKSLTTAVDYYNHLDPLSMSAAPAKPRPPIDPLERIRAVDQNNYEWSLSVRINQLSLVMDRQMTRLLAEHAGLTYSEWRVLAVLSRAGPATFGFVVALTVLDKALASRAIGTLAVKKLVRKWTTPRDKRGVTMEITARGRNLMDKFAPIWRARQAQMLESLSRAERVLLYNMIDTLADKVESFDLPAH